jgi:autophagy-related protein 11
MGQEADCLEEESISHPTYIIGQIVLIEQHTRLLGQMRGASHPDSSGGHRAPASMLIPYILPGGCEYQGAP